jgi:hypothetical protein
VGVVARYGFKSANDACSVEGGAIVFFFFFPIPLFAATPASGGFLKYKSLHTLLCGILMILDTSLRGQIVETHKLGGCHFNSTVKIVLIYIFLVAILRADSSPRYICCGLVGGDNDSLTLIPQSTLPYHQTSTPAPKSHS